MLSKYLQGKNPKLFGNEETVERRAGTSFLLLKFPGVFHGQLPHFSLPGVKKHLCRSDLKEMCK